MRSENLGGSNGHRKCDFDEQLGDPASTLTSILTMSMGNTVMGTLENNVLWSLATILLLMALFFNILTRYIGKEAVKK